MITVADLYHDEGVFRIYNRKELGEGLAPSMSKDNSWIAYILVRNNLHLMTTGTNGMGTRELPFPDSLILQGVSISPIGTEIAVSYQRVGSSVDLIYLGVVASSGGTVRVLSTDPGRSLSPSWSPDGERVYFTWVDSYNKYGHNIPGGFLKAYVRSVDRGGRDLRTISDTVSGVSSDSEPAVSPDGSQIAFASTRNYPNNFFPEIFLMSMDGKNLRQLTNCIGCLRHGDHFDTYTEDGSPLWLDDGLHIVFQRISYTYDHETRKYSQLRDLYVINEAAKRFQNLTNDGISTLRKP